jgi:simple sugar transport system ATP-binding protein
VHAVLGENGAGKTTLLRILYGLLDADSGEIHVHGRHVDFQSPMQARALGIGLIPQRILILPTLTVLENLFLGHTQFRSLRTSHWHRAGREVERIMAAYGLEIPLEGRGRDLSVGQAQRLQILRALLQGARVLLCDEPTSVLAPPEVDNLFVTLRTLRDEGACIVFITHKLAEATEIADEVTILRSGRVVGKGTMEDFGHDRLAGLIVGDRKVEVSRRDPQDSGEVQLSIESLGTEGPRGLKDVNLSVPAGRIVGVAGVEGNGQQELLEILGGMRTWQVGRIRMGKEFWEAPGPLPPRRLDAIPDDRLGLGLVGELSIGENILLGNLDRAGGLWLQRERLGKVTDEILHDFGVQPALPGLPVDALSGGNQQRLLVGREILRAEDVLVASQPTQGVDVASKAAIHARILAERRRGRSALLISSDLDEILHLSDHIHVLYRGAVIYEASAERVDPQRLARAMVGWGEEDAGEA